MSLKGTLIKLEDGGYGFRHEYIHHAEPKKIIQIWPVNFTRQTGTWAAQDAAIGKDATCRDGVIGVYLGDGAWWEGVMPQRGQTQALSTTEEAIPCPKVRASLQRRWNGYDYRWEKLLKKGWVPA